MSRTITREDLATAAQDAAISTSIARDEAKALVDQVIDEISDALVARRESREPIKILNFGSFVAWRSPPRNNVRNPKRPDEHHPGIPARWRVVFRPARELIAKMNPGRQGGAHSGNGNLTAQQRRTA